ncbi:hypothetical protein [Microbacterium sp. R86528]|uniref:hypothetical protein n=1 Tax=Microbacterium sp. R86528 TaxID=3093864 RepID=UPI0037C8A0B0
MAPTIRAQEGPTGTWSLLDTFDRGYGTIELRRVSATDLRYRVAFRGEVIGWSTTLRLARERLHAEFLRSHGPSGGPIASWGTGNRERYAEKPYAASMSSSSRKSSAGNSATPSSFERSEASGLSRRRVRSRIPAGPRSTVRFGSM